MAMSADNADYALMVSSAKPKIRTGSRKGSASSASVDEGATAWRCEECGKLFRSDKDRVLECEFCEKHYCIRCLKYKPGEYEAMQKPGCVWFCLPCKPKIEKNILNEKVIEERCQFYFESINARLDEVERKLEGKCDENQVKEMIRKTMEDGQRDAPIQGQVIIGAAENDKTLKDTLKEVQDQKGRETNFLIFRAPEPQTNLKEVREREDLKLVEGLCNEVCQANINIDEDIVKTIRLGKKSEEGENKNRPLLVIMKDSGSKERVFKKLSNLKAAPDKYK